MRVGVLGGGLVGLVVAGHAEHDCEVLEAEATTGGQCRSLVKDGYTFDIGGPHILFSRNQEILDYMLAQLGDNCARRRRDVKIWVGGRLVKYPFENGLYDLAPEDRFECLYHYLHNGHPKPTNFREWIYHTFGTGIAERYMLPYNEKIWNIPAERMAFDWVDGRVPKPPVEDVIRSAVGVETEGSPHQLYFHYPRHGGIEAMVKAFERRCKSVTTGFRVRSVRRDGPEWVVSDGERERRYDRLVSTIAVQDLLRALPEVPEAVTAAAGRLTFNSLTVAMLGFKGPPSPYTAFYVPDPEIPFHRLTFPTSLTDEGAPPDRMAVLAEITTNPGDACHDLSDAEVVAKVVGGLEKMGLAKGEDLVWQAVSRSRYAYVVRTPGCSQALDTVLSWVSAQGIASVGRIAEFEYINMDEAVRRGLDAAKALGA